MSTCQILKSLRRWICFYEVESENSLLSHDGLIGVNQCENNCGSSWPLAQLESKKKKKTQATLPAMDASGLTIFFFCMNEYWFCRKLTLMYYYHHIQDCVKHTRLFRCSKVINATFITHDSFINSWQPSTSCKIYQHYHTLSTSKTSTF